MVRWMEDIINGDNTGKWEWDKEKRENLFTSNKVIQISSDTYFKQILIY